MPGGAEATRPSRTSIQVAITLLFAVSLTALLVTTRPPASRNCQALVIASSQEKFGMLQEFASTYNRTAQTIGSQCMAVTVEQVNSGDAEAALEQGWVGLPAARPDVWAPASSAWVSLLLEASNDRAIKPVGSAPSLFKSPLVIGLPKQMADALGYPANPLGWRDIFALVKNPQAWKAKSRPEWGPFKLGKTNPTVSTSGLHALIGTYFAAPGTGMTVERINSAPVHDFVAGVEAGVVHYGQTAADFLRNLRDASDHGQALLYVSAVAIEEQELVDYNEGIIGGKHFGAPSVSLVAVYPSEGTLVADHPYVILNSSRRTAAEDFFRFLARPEQQQAIDGRGFRTVGSIDRGFAGPSLRQHRIIDANQPALVLQPPHGTVLRAMVSAWQLLRKRARVLILVDAAADPELLRQATQRLADAVSKFNSTDVVGAWVFPAPSNYATPYIELVRVGSVTSELNARLRSISHTTDRSDLAKSTRAAVDWMAAGFDPAALDAVLLVEMSPGKPNQADVELEQFLRNQPVDHFVRVFTVGPEGRLPDAKEDVLRDYALAGRGVTYQPGSASHLLNDVISNF